MFKSGGQFSVRAIGAGVSHSQLKPAFLQRVSIACYAERCISRSKSVRLSVRPSVRLSVTRWH